MSIGCRLSAAPSMAAAVAMAASRPTPLPRSAPVVLAELQMGATPEWVRAVAVQVAVVVTRVTASTVAADNRVAAKAERTVRQTVWRGVAEMVASVVSVAMAATTWCPQQMKRRSPSALSAAQASRASQGAVAVVAVAGLVRCSSSVVAAAAEAQAVPLAAVAAAVVAVADLSASMLSASIAL